METEERVDKNCDFNTSVESAGNGHAGENKDQKKRSHSVVEPPEADTYTKLKRRRTNKGDIFGNPSIAQLKKTGECYVQDCLCFEIANKLMKCRECRTSSQANNIFCRFYGFRKLRYTRNGVVAIAGFSDPAKDSNPDDIKLWMPNAENPPEDLNLQQARFILTQVADQFCDLLAQENAVYAEYMSKDKDREKEERVDYGQDNDDDGDNDDIDDDDDDDDDDVEKIVAWKRVVEGVREMCDVCETTLFNYHWTCEKCGFVVCIDCYQARKSGQMKIWNDGAQQDRDEHFWLMCSKNTTHNYKNLILSQIIAGDALKILGKRVHEARAMWDIPQQCGCVLSKQIAPKEQFEVCQELMRNVAVNNDNSKNIVKTEVEEAEAVITTGITSKPPSDLAVKLTKDENDDFLGIKEDDNISDCSSSADESDFILRDILSANTDSKIEELNTAVFRESEHEFKQILKDALDGASSRVEQNTNENDETQLVASNGRRGGRYIPIRIMTLTTSSSMYPDVPHTWLCEGKLLRLLNPLNPGNVKLFQEQWKRGQPVIVSKVSSCLNMDLWRPEAFSKDFGEDANDLVNCMTGTLVPNQPMKRFWDGFDYVNKRIKDESGNPMLLKLKDWPPGEDFAEILPTRFNDLMRCLPLGEYTKRNGKFNLASRLPNAFVKPDLGPKMYNAYGSALYPTKGTTNLHLDISDAVNVMVYVGIPKDTGTDDSHIREAYHAIDEAGCDILTRRRVREGGELPGALWHIYAPRDADKIRDLLNKICIERGERLERNHDPIHDQSWYLDAELRQRLYKEYGVEGYPIAQCLGDAVFIPAGAPHQVRNLHNCVKVAEDFVSPENVSECFHLTHEFRALSYTHSNHEDKLQIKNIIYHAVKDSLSTLEHIFNKHTNDTLNPEQIVKQEPIEEDI